jgi:hypothetical protein
VFDFCLVPVRVPEAGLDKKLIWFYQRCVLSVISRHLLLLCFALLTHVLLVALLRMI